MAPLQMVELRPQVPALLNFLKDQDLDLGRADQDLAYGIHAWLGAAFGDLAPRPWRLLADRHRPTRVLGYATANADQLRQRLIEFAQPAVFTVCRDPATDIASKPMPNWRSGRRLAFELLACPVGRKSGSGIEKDLFLMQADSAGPGELDRGTVYSEWVRKRLEREQACKVGAIQLAGFSLARHVRRAQAKGGPRKIGRLVRPRALLRGELTVVDPAAFNRLVTHGIGRHRAFGYGMVLLGPPA